MDETDESISRIDSIFTIILENPPSCIEWSPSSPDIVVIGTYTLSEPNDSSEGAQSRSGSLVIYRLVGKSLQILQTVPTSAAVLDLHFSPHRSEVLAVATSTGVVEIYHLRVVDSMYLERLLIVQAFDPATLVLSLAWHPSPKRATEVAVSLSDGNVALLDYAKNPSIQVVKEVHALEAWTVSWSSLSSLSDECVLYSGGDDSGLRTFLPEQLRSDVACNDGDTESASSAIAPLFNTKIHSAGVTAILSLKLAGHSTQETVLTGSYDEYIRVLAPSPKGVWKVLAERRLGGGVWRLKQIPGLEKSGMSSPTQSTFHILASCMHAGARVLQICRTDHDTWSINVLYKFEEHESMNYGSDVTILQDQDEGKNPLIMVVSTSFYDRRLCLWMIPSFSNISNTSDITLKSIT